MADPPPDPDPDAGVEPDCGTATSTPRWVKVFGIIAIVLVLLFVGLQFLGVGGSHGPGRHTPSGDAGGQSPPSSVTPSGSDLGGHTPPDGRHR